jgi:hypothetical protein
MSRGWNTTLALVMAVVWLAALPALASAVTLETESGPMSESDPITAFSEDLKFTTPSAVISCAESELNGGVTASGGEPAEIKLTEGSFTGTGGARCATSIGSVTADVEANAETENWELDLWLLEVEGVELGGTGKVTGEEEVAPIEIKVDLYMGATKFASCFYAASEVAVEYEFQVPLESPTGLVLPGSTLTSTPESAEVCPAEGVLSGEFEISSEAAPVSIGQAGIGFTPAAGLNFKGSAAKTVKVITIENIGTAQSKLEDAWVQEGKKRTEADFKLVPLGGLEPCKLPGKVKPFETLNIKETCRMGIEFVSGAANKNAEFVVEVEGSIRKHFARLPITS